MQTKLMEHMRHCHKQPSAGKAAPTCHCIQHGQVELSIWLAPLCRWVLRRRWLLPVRRWLGVARGTRRRHVGSWGCTR